MAQTLSVTEAARHFLASLPHLSATDAAQLADDLQGEFLLYGQLAHATFVQSR
jgi:hypothetical protein